MTVIHIKSKLFISGIILLGLLCLSEEDSTNNFELCFSRGSWHSADFYLTLERTVLPVAVSVLVIFIHLQTFVSIFMDKFEDIGSIEVFFILFVETLDYPVVI